jgi:hypothetical protein
MKKKTKAKQRKLTKRSIVRAKGERTCVHCGCTDSRACPGGCEWALLHKATPTGVCTPCWHIHRGIAVGCISVLAAPNIGKLQLMVNEGPNAGEGLETDEVKLEKVLVNFFRRNF